MARSNVEVIRDQYAATNERDFERAMAHYADDVVLVVHGEGIRAGTFEGREAVGRWFGEWFSTFDRDARFEIRRISELEDGSVALVADHQARGRGSGIELHGTVAWLYRLREGKIVRVEGNTALAQLPADEAWDYLRSQTLNRDEQQGDV
jgi:ketosteroid isomerase-like protein